MVTAPREGNKGLELVKCSTSVLLPWTWSFNKVWSMVQIWRDFSPSLCCSSLLAPNNAELFEKTQPTQQAGQNQEFPWPSHHWVIRKTKRWDKRTIACWMRRNIWQSNNLDALKNVQPDKKSSSHSSYVKALKTIHHSFLKPRNKRGNKSPPDYGETNCQQTRLQRKLGKRKKRSPH